MVALCNVMSLFFLFIFITDALGTEETLNDLLREMSSRRSMSSIWGDSNMNDQMRNDMDEMWSMMSDLDARPANSLGQAEVLGVRDNQLPPKPASSTPPPPTLTRPTSTVAPPPLTAQPLVCSGYKILNESWRHIDYVNRSPLDKVPTHCDKTGQYYGEVWGSRPWITYTNLTLSWYRFTGLAGSKLPTGPAPVGGPPSFRGEWTDMQNGQLCGTAAVAYITSGGNPTWEEGNQGIVTREVCFEWNRYPCESRTTVKIARCRDEQGDYFVYQLPPVPTCDNAYCAID